MYEILLKTFSCHFKPVTWYVCHFCVTVFSCASQLLVGSQLSQLPAMSFYAAPGFQPVATVVGYRWVDCSLVTLCLNVEIVCDFCGSWCWNLLSSSLNENISYSCVSL